MASASSGWVQLRNFVDMLVNLHSIKSGNSLAIAAIINVCVSKSKEIFGNTTSEFRNSYLGI
jgi:hypothetical protein